YLTVWKIQDVNATPLVLLRGVVKGLQPYTFPAPAPQLGGTPALDSGDTRLLKAIYRNGYIYTARDTGYPDAPTTSTFDIIDTSTIKFVTQGIIFNANVFYPAFDVPATVPTGLQFANGNIITGTTTAPDGTLTFAGLSNGGKAGED